MLPGKTKARKVLVFVFFALLGLAIGCIPTFLLWREFFSSIHSAPSTGFYHGKFDIKGDSIKDEEFYHRFEIRGESLPRWYWSSPTSFVYNQIEVSWEEEDGRPLKEATVRLPSFEYQFNGSTGVLSRAVLARWLIGATNSPTVAETLRLDAVYGFVEAAANGSLRMNEDHRGLRFNLPRPLHGSMKHSDRGFGIPGLLFVWFGIWLCLVVGFAQRAFPRNEHFRRANSADRTSRPLLP